MCTLTGCSDPDMASNPTPAEDSAFAVETYGCALAPRAPKASLSVSEEVVRKVMPPKWHVGQRWVVRNESRFRWAQRESRIGYVDWDGPDISYEWYEVEALTSDEAMVVVERNEPESDLELIFHLKPFYLREGRVLVAKRRTGSVPLEPFFWTSKPTTFWYLATEDLNGTQIGLCDCTRGCPPGFPYESEASEPVQTVRAVADGLAFSQPLLVSVEYWRTGEPWPSSLMPSHQCVRCLVRSEDGSVFVPSGPGDLPTHELRGVPRLPIVVEGVFDPSGPQWDGPNNVNPAWR